MALFQLTITTPKGLFLQQNITRLNVWSESGQMGVLHNHIPLTANIQISILETIINGQKKRYSISGGLMLVEREETIIITNAVEARQNINYQRVLQARKRAEERLKLKAKHINLQRAEIALAKALNRLQLK